MGEWENRRMGELGNGRMGEWENENRDTCWCPNEMESMGFALRSNFNDNQITIKLFVAKQKE